MSGRPWPSLKAQRKKEATERNAKWQGLTPTQKLARLNERLGVDVGATRQRKILEAQLAST